MQEEDFLTLNLNSEEINNMSIERKMEYFKEYKTYMELLLRYLIEKTDIKKYDDLIANDSHNFKSLKNDNMDIYQKFANNFLKYFYIRNNLHLERLKEEEKEFLDNKINNNYSFDNNCISFIENTFRRLIYEIINDNPDITGYINYGPFSENYIALNDSLVIGFRYDEFNENGYSDEEWENNYFEQKAILEEIINKLEKSIREKIRVNCKVIQYDEFSIVLPNKTK